MPSSDVQLLSPFKGIALRAFEYRNPSLMDDMSKFRLRAALVEAAWRLTGFGRCLAKVEALPADGWMLGSMGGCQN